MIGRSSWRPGHTVDFFVSYRSEAVEHARRVSETLERHTYTTVVQDKDFRPGDEFMALVDAALDCCDWLLALLTPAYFSSVWCRDEWVEATRRGKLVPVQVEDCRLRGPWRSRIAIDLVGTDSEEATVRLLRGIRALSYESRSTSEHLRIGLPDLIRQSQLTSPWTGAAEYYNHPQLRPRPEDIRAGSSFEARRVAGRRLEGGDY